MANQPSTKHAGEPPALPGVRWLRNHKEIARFLKLKASPKRLREIGGWIARSDFPRKQKKGFVGEEVRAWYLRLAAEQAKADAPLLAAKQIIEQGRVPGKRALANLESQKSEVRSQNVALGNPGPVPSQAAMAVELQLRYQLPIKRQTICNWIHGIHLPKGAPRFPLNDGGRAGWNDPQPCYDWYEQWIVNPTKNALAEDAVQGNLFEQKRADAAIAEFEEQIDKARKARSEADALERANSAKWILRDEARATGMQAVNDILRIVEAEYERNAPQRRREKLAGLVAEVRSQEIGVGTGVNASFDLLVSSFFAFDCEDERGRFDRIKAACAAKAE